MAKIEDVAARAGVSVATVSRALRGLPNVAAATRERVEAAARELDYVMSPSASRLAAGRTHTLGMVIPHLETWYGSHVMAAVHRVWSDAGYDLLPIVLRDHEGRQRFLGDLPFRKRVDGLLLLDLPFDDDEYDRLLGTGVALVTAGPPTTRTPSVGIDDREAARVLVQHLVGLGHRDVAVIIGDVDEPFTWAGPTERLAGFDEALAAAGIEVDDDRRAVTDWSPEAGVAATEQLLDTRPDPPTALLCFSDELAIAAMGVLRRRGLDVPGDVSVAGYDDHHLAEHVGLTTTHQPVATLGHQAATLLLRQLRDEDVPVRRQILPTRLVVRESTAAPRPARPTRPAGPRKGRGRRSARSSSPSSSATDARTAAAPVATP